MAIEQPRLTPNVSVLPDIGQPGRALQKGEELNKWLKTFHANGQGVGAGADRESMSETERKLREIDSKITIRQLKAKLKGPVVFHGEEILDENYNRTGGEDYIEMPPGNFRSDPRDMLSGIRELIRGGVHRGAAQGIQGELVNSHTFAYLKNPNNPKRALLSMIFPDNFYDRTGRPSLAAQITLGLPTDSLNQLLEIIRDDPNAAEQFFQISTDGLDQSLSRLPRGQVALVDLDRFISPEKFPEKSPPLHQLVSDHSNRLTRDGLEIHPYSTESPSDDNKARHPASPEQGESVERERQESAKRMFAETFFMYIDKPPGKEGLAEIEASVDAMRAAYPGEGIDQLNARMDRIIQEERARRAEVGANSPEAGKSMSVGKAADFIAFFDRERPSKMIDRVNPENSVRLAKAMLALVGNAREVIPGILDNEDYKREVISSVGMKLFSNIADADRHRDDDYYQEAVVNGARTIRALGLDEEIADPETVSLREVTELIFDAATREPTRSPVERRQEVSFVPRLGVFLSAIDLHRFLDRGSTVEDKNQAVDYVAAIQDLTETAMLETARVFSDDSCREAMAGELRGQLADARKVHREWAKVVAIDMENLGLNYASEQLQQEVGSLLK